MYAGADMSQCTYRWLQGIAYISPSPGHGPQSRTKVRNIHNMQNPHIDDHPHVHLHEFVYTHAHYPHTPNTSTQYSTDACMHTYMQIIQLPHKTQVAQGQIHANAVREFSACSIQIMKATVQITQWCTDTPSQWRDACTVEHL